MDQTVRATLSDAERQHAAALLDGEARDVKQAVAAVFADLDDPLLSVDDVVALLGAQARRTEVIEALGVLVEEGTLEVTDKTQRAFDPEGVRLYRLGGVPAGVLRLVALESVDSDDRRRYQFTVNGRLIRSIARIDRLNALDDSGNQRDEIRRHVEKIASGIRSGTQVPSAVLLVLLDETTVIIDQEEGYDDEATPQSFIKIKPFDDAADWIEVLHQEAPVQNVRLVQLEVPYRKAAFDDEKSILLVDGQQRTAALSLVSVDERPAVDMAATAVVANPIDAKRVFQVANETVKISTDFTHALLASMDEPPGYLKPEKVRADAAKRLALTSDTSPLQNLVKHPGAKVVRPPVAYNSLFAVVSEFADGLPDDLVGTPEALTNVIEHCYAIIRDVWPEAWGLKPSESRLMHGAGLRAMAALAVSKLGSYLENGRSLDEDETWVLFKASMKRLREKVVWTGSEAVAGTRTIKTNFQAQIMNRQNTAQDIKQLADWLRKESLELDMKASKGKL